MSFRIKLFISLFSIYSLSINAQQGLKIIEKPVCFGMRTSQNRNIDAIIIHSVYNKSGGDKYDVDLILNQFSHYHVSSHYIIGREGAIYQLVKEKDIAFQAGKSRLPDGRTGVNFSSIGIELITSKDSLDSPTEKQIKALTLLVKDIKNRHNIKYVLRHSDIAPGRKTDPWNMNWEDFLKRIGG
jgi:Negative regulator of beta-lactamase expression